MELHHRRTGAKVARVAQHESGSAKRENCRRKNSPREKLRKGTWRRFEGMDFSEKSIEGGDGSRRADKRWRGGRDERQGGFRKRGNSLEGFHAGTRPRATAQSIELSISRLGGSSDKVTHPLVPHLPFASRSSRPLFCFSSLSLRVCVCVCVLSLLFVYISSSTIRPSFARAILTFWVIANRTEPVDRREPLPRTKEAWRGSFWNLLSKSGA